MTFSIKFGRLLKNSNGLRILLVQSFILLHIKESCFMKSDKLSVVRSWFKKAENDLTNVEHTMKMENPPCDTVYGT